jgi:hypothetical protein
VPEISTSKSGDALLIEQPPQVTVCGALDVLPGGGLLDVLPLVVQQHG